jgi:hypothetical protein
VGTSDGREGHLPAHPLDLNIILELFFVLRELEQRENKIFNRPSSFWEGRALSRSP